MLRRLLLRLSCREYTYILLDGASSSREIRVYIGVSFRFLWGGILMCHAACQNYGGLVTARFFLGVGEAAVAPGFGLITGMFYKREEQPAR